MLSDRRAPESAREQESRTRRLDSMPGICSILPSSPSLTEGEALDGAVERYFISPVLAVWAGFFLGYTVRYSSFSPTFRRNNRRE